MKNSELQSLNVDELHGRLAEEKEALRKLKFAHAVTPIENPMKIRHSRKTIARILTQIRIKETQIDS
ncbi:MAG: 50S ribosomal protein L29 [Bacteroidetes bacterium]|nr:50S ribosomal protein L29 [Bacteroidota bacterium]MDA1119495.1 50S ribosomal protein L29 [Bacteroidota bacterium]